MLKDVWGPHRLHVLRTPAGTAVKALFIDGEDYTDRSIDFAAKRQASVRLVLTTNTSSTRGVVRDGNGTAVADCDVILFPSAERAWDIVSPLVRRTTTDAAGAFSFTDLPARVYFVVAVIDLPAQRWREPEFLSVVSGASLRVALREGEHENIRLSPITAPR